MATKINIKNIPTGYQSIITNGRHSIVGDEPEKVNGTDLGMTPTELVLAGIAMCKVATIRNIARSKNIEIENIDAELSQITKRNTEGNYTTEVNSAIKISGNITPEQKAMLIQEADNCYVTRLIKGDWVLNDSTDVH
ncbi:OsmC family protein [Maribacter sp. PR1]|uniref:OsmC family protein n=1 Tax=Maribacter cobaltidurans TaxID=1178778 RepID=A0ABU7ITS0_9FLAO|nr:MULTISPECIES: OsmC family protein [Maribacter]MDC6388987.1 OsmC family protein [Maribacter sp. PR1]MEE1976375.1 OsmC family protein [Maribacter cobaltidurans]